MVIFADADPQRHARKAVQTALEIVPPRHTAQYPNSGTFAPIYLHVGINSGLALVGPTKLEGANGTRWTYTATGSVTNLAARIAAAGEGGAVFVGPEPPGASRVSFPCRRLVNSNYITSRKR